MPEEQTAPIRTLFTPAEAPQPEEWVHLEIKGKREHYGRLTDYIRFGMKFVCIEVFFGDDDEPSLTRYYNASSIYAIEPSTEAVCRTRIRHGRRLLPTLDEAEAQRLATAEAEA